MKKSFMFVAVAAAGMLASCSSDSLTAGPDPNIEPTQEDLVPIEISVATPMARLAQTRGTGTVGGVEDGSDNAVNNDGTSFGAKNIWAGQKINVYMFKTGTLNLAYFKDGDAAGIFDNAEMDTPAATEDTNEGRAHYVDPAASGRYLEKYYPLEGVYDFWGYRIDDATVNSAPAKNAGGDLFSANITVDGTQDVLGAKTVPAKWENLTDAQKGQFANETEYNTYISSSGKLYSASAARKLVQPRLEFNHLMTRLTFEAYPGNDNAKTVYITGIKVRPLSEYNATDTTYVTNKGKLDIAGTGDGFAQKITWDTADGPLDPANQYQFELMKRDVTLGKNAYTGIAAASWYSWNSTPTDNRKFIDAAAYAALPTGTGKTSYTVLAADSWYSLNSDPTNRGEFKSASEYASLTDKGKLDYTGIAADSWYSLNSAPTNRGEFKSASEYAGLSDGDKALYTVLAADSWYSLNSDPTNRGEFKSASEYASLNDKGKSDYTGIAANSWYSLNDDPANRDKFKNATDYNALVPVKSDYTVLAANSWYSLNSVPKNKTQFIDPTAYGNLVDTSTGDVDGNQTLVALNDVSMNVTPSNDPDQKVAIGEAIIAPDAKAYELEINLKQSVAKYENSVPATPTDWQEYEFGVVKTVVTNAGGDFEVGKSYDFIIKVYGLEKIEVIAVLKPWEFGEKIDVVTE